MIARIATLAAAGLLLVGCSSEEGMRAQELLQQAETAQAQLRSSTFEGAIGIKTDGEAFKLLPRAPR